MGFNSGFKGLMYINKTNYTCFHSRILHLDIIKVLLPTDAQENCFKMIIKIYIKTAPTCFCVITIIRERTIWACWSYSVKTVN